MGRARSRNPKRHQHCLRLTDRQEELLQRYADFKEYGTDMDAIRALIDGLEDWFKRQEAKLASRQAELEADLSALRPGPRRTGDGAQTSPVTPPSDVGPDESINAVSDGEAEDTSVGDFGGRPSVGLPGAHHDGTD